VPVGYPSELDDPGQPDLELVGRVTESEIFRAFVEGAARILVVVAAGGSGKTRFLRALPELAWGTRPRRPVWLRRPGQGTLDDAFLNGLPARKPIVIVLDDAAQASADLAELARLAAVPSMVDVKLVLSIRAVDREATERALAKIRGIVTWNVLAELPVAEASRIAKLECPSLSSGDATRLARAFGSNLFLLRAAAQQVRRGEQPATVVNDEHIRRLVATRLIEEAQRHLSRGATKEARGHRGCVAGGSATRVRRCENACCRVTCVCRRVARGLHAFRRRTTTSSLSRCGEIRVRTS